MLNLFEPMNKIPAHVTFRMEKFPQRSWHSVLDQVAFKPGLTVAEIGAEGPDSQYLQQVRQAHVIAVNKYAEMINKVAEYGIEDRLLADQQETGIEDQSVDMAFSANVLPLADDPEQALRELKRITKPGGKIVVVTDYWENDATDTGEKVLSADQLVDLFPKCGLKIINQEVMHIPEKNWRTTPDLEIGTNFDLPPGPDNPYVLIKNPYLVIEAAVSED